MTIAQRFWAKVDSSGGMGSCWPWGGTISGNGYGQFWIGGRHRPAHQVAWELWHAAPFPATLQGRHSCDNPPCVNPLHLSPGTIQQNADDRAARGRAYRPIGEKHHNARLTVELVRQIRARAAAGEPQNALAHEFGVVQSNVSRIVNRKTWTSC